MHLSRQLIVGSIILLSACASIRSGKYAEPEAKGQDKHASTSGVVISGAENASLSSTHFAEVDFTFENKSADWIRIKSVTLDFGDPALNEAVKLPVGNDLIAWAKAAEQNKAISDYNTAMVLGSVAAVGSVAAMTSRDQGVQSAGALAALGATGGLAVSSIRDERRKVELAKVVPPDHILSDGFVNPPGLHAKKWVAFYTRDPKALPRIKYVAIAYTLENGQTERAHLDFRAPGSRWQR